MADLTVTAAGTGETVTTATTATLTLTAAAEVGDVVVVVVAADNNGTGGTSSIAGVSDSGGNTYQKVVEDTANPFGTTKSGATGGIYSTTVTTALTTSDTVTLTSDSAVAQALAAWVVHPPTGSTAEIAASSAAVQTFDTNTATATTSAITAGDSLIAGAAIEYGDTTKTYAVTADTDTDSGSWSAAQQAQGGNSGTRKNNMIAFTQTKTPSATGAQTYDVSWFNPTDSVIVWVSVHQVVAATATPELFGPPLKERREPEQRRTISLTNTTRLRWSIETEVVYVDEADELILLDLI